MGAVGNSLGCGIQTSPGASQRKEMRLKRRPKILLVLLMSAVGLISDLSAGSMYSTARWMMASQVAEARMILLLASRASP